MFNFNPFIKGEAYENQVHRNCICDRFVHNSERLRPGGQAAGAGDEKTTITVWDYYGEATPIKPLLEGFMKENPNITVQYEALDWDTTLEKLNVVLTGGTLPTL